MSRNPDFDAVMIRKTELERLKAEIVRLEAENAEQKAELQKLYSVLTIDPLARAALEPKP